jgi:hypothetical protein
MFITLFLETASLYTRDLIHASVVVCNRCIPSRVDLVWEYVGKRIFEILPDIILSNF